MGGVVVVIFLLIVVGLVVVRVKTASGKLLRFEAAGSPHQVLLTAVGILGQRRDWHLVSQNAEGATFRFQKGPNVLVAVVLLFFFLLPGIVYLVIARKEETMVVMVSQAQSGGTFVQVTANGPYGKAARRVLGRQMGVRTAGAETSSKSLMP